jgi:hypothetical protein
MNEGKGLSKRDFHQGGVPLQSFCKGFLIFLPEETAGTVEKIASGAKHASSMQEKTPLKLCKNTNFLWFHPKLPLGMTLPGAGSRTGSV